MANKEEHIISLKDIDLGYVSGQDLVNDVNVNVGVGEMIALVGRNGTGKSTLLRTIAGFSRPLKGEVLLQHKNIVHYRPNELAELLSFVGTSKEISENLTVYEMVSLGRHPYTNWWGHLKNSDVEKIMEAISFVGMQDHLDSKVEQLSDGERQRVMIATALAQDTRVIILDEPTAFLDIPNRIGIAEVLYKMKLAGRSVIFSTHDFDTAFSYADKLWVINDHYLQAGSPEDLGIERIFEQIFKASGIVFDAENLRFRRAHKFEKAICLKPCQTSDYQWTTRALERIGYEVRDSNQGGLPVIEIHNSGTERSWLLKEGSNSTVYSSLYLLVSYLTKHG